MYERGYSLETKVSKFSKSRRTVARVYKAGSDVDIAIWGETVTLDTVSRLRGQLEEESLMPYFFDIVDYTHLNHDDLRQHIDRVGKIIFSRED